MVVLMAEPLRNPQPLVNQELDTCEEHLRSQVNEIGEEIEYGLSDAPVYPESPLGRRSTGQLLEFKEAVSERLQDARKRASEAVEQTRERAANAYDQVQAQVTEAVSQAREKIQDLAQQAGTRARYYGREYPLQVIAVAAGAGFVLGVLLRIWRSSRYE